ncbi:MAG: hypothetical protein A2664_02965 [Candidatus Taylorbacteria bacterium RIFCSPHIGHO2_01_FULL_46_22b]|uniref:SGNH hydrolase-type esterase domain-containing protein n=1 Tax=Candidatus Taylorbacteria bacterium RIFCSPHIGHO2_01_FULL_46_22b TaxID=1802301 RepID=A0A1G2M482_9BACT|nr:MAG: hypothetical protein A2664_02965 [Candidatus Taylorbacteria bacterium RIFCSPHIGHO2_01_FULL_46_22b]
MKTIKLIVAGIFLGRNLLLAQMFPGYTISVTPTNTVADGVGGEETYVQWEAPFGAITLADFIRFYLLPEGGGQELIWFKQEILRADNSQYAFTGPGEYKVLYAHFSFFQYYETASTHVSVRPTTSLVQNARNYPPKQGPIVAFGDSLTEGVGSTHSNLVSWLEAYTGYSIINAGVSGDTTGDALLRIEHSVLAHNPSLVIVFLGGNDLLNQLPSSQTFSNLHQIVARIQNQGAVALVIGIYNGLLADRYREEFHELYTSTRSVFVPDILQGILGNPFTIGGTHPNDEGYRRMALRIAPLVRKIMGTMLTIQRSGNLMSVEWFGNTNTVYDLLFSDQLTTSISSWNVLNTSTGANALISIPIVTTNSPRYFGVRVR